MCLHTIYHCRNLDGQIKISCKKPELTKSLSVVVYLLILELERPKDAEQYGWKTYVPKFEYTTDNVIGIVGYQKFYHNNLKLLL
jgi:hypothetical protein